MIRVSEGRKSITQPGVKTDLYKKQTVKFFTGKVVFAKRITLPTAIAAFEKMRANLSAKEQSYDKKVQ